MKKILYIFIPLIIIFVLAIAANQIQQTLNQSENTVEETQSSLDEDAATNTNYYTLSDLNTAYGTAGFVPANFPEFSLRNIQNYWEETNQFKTYGVHVDWQDTQLIETATEEFDGKINLVLGFQKPDDWQQSETFLNTVREILDKNPRIAFLAIGNEINITKDAYPNEFPQFIDGYKRMYELLKKEYPDILISTTLQYEYLKGDGELFGGKENRDTQWEILDSISTHIDVVALTTYPHLDYTAPSQVPNNYLDAILSRSDKPLVITETGWPSRSSFPTEFKTLETQGFSSSESEQAEFTQNLEAWKTTYNPLFIQWAFLHDYTNGTEGQGSGEQIVFDSIGLKYNNGEEKEVWKQFQNLSAKR